MMLVVTFQEAGHVLQLWDIVRAVPTVLFQQPERFQVFATGVRGVQVPQSQVDFPPVQQKHYKHPQMWHIYPFWSTKQHKHPLRPLPTYFNNCIRVFHFVLVALTPTDAETFVILCGKEILSSVALAAALPPVANGAK